MTNQTSTAEPGQITVLVVEDEPLVRMSAADFLMQSGYKVFEAANADEALEMLRARADVHAVFTDIEMPGTINGIGLAKTIEETWPGIAVILTSGQNRADGDDLPEAAAFLSKPYLLETVIALIGHAVRLQVVDPAAIRRST